MIQIPDAQYRILIKSHQSDIDKIYLYAKGPYEAQFQLLINKSDNASLSNSLILKLLLDIQMIWMIFIKIVKNTIETKNIKYCLYLMI